MPIDRKHVHEKAAEAWGAAATLRESPHVRAWLRQCSSTRVRALLRRAFSTRTYGEFVRQVEDDLQSWEKATTDLMKPRVRGLRRRGQKAGLANPSMPWTDWDIKMKELLERPEGAVAMAKAHEPSEEISQDFWRCLEDQMILL
jgi:hypothetical protein